MRPRGHPHLAGTEAATVASARATRATSPHALPAPARPLAAGPRPGSRCAIGSVDPRNHAAVAASVLLHPPPPQHPGATLNLHVLSTH